MNGLGTVVALLGTASRVGVVVSNSILGPMLGSVSWNRLIQAGAVVYFVGAATVIALCGKPNVPTSPTVGATTVPPTAVITKAAPLAELIRAVFTTPRILLAFATATLLNPVFCFASVLPLFLTEGLGMTEVAAASTSSAFPIGAMLSILSCSFIWDKLSEKGRWLWCTGSLLLTITATALISRGRVTGRTPMFVALAAVTGGTSTCTLCMQHTTPQ